MKKGCGLTHRPNLHPFVHICLYRVDQCTERIKAVAHKVWVLSSFLLNLFLDRQSTLLIAERHLILPYHCGKMSVFRAILHLGTQLPADCRYRFQLSQFLIHHRRCRLRPPCFPTLRNGCPCRGNLGSPYSRFLQHGRESQPG